MKTAFYITNAQALGLRLVIDLAKDIEKFQAAHTLDEVAAYTTDQAAELPEVLEAFDWDPLTARRLVNLVAANPGEFRRGLARESRFVELIG